MGGRAMVSWGICILVGLSETGKDSVRVLVLLGMVDQRGKMLSGE